MTRVVCLHAALCASVSLLLVVALHAQLPRPSGAVNDFADVLTADDEHTLTALVERVEATTSAEIAVATVTSLDGMSVEEYATRLFAEWGVGREDKDNGVLILVAPTAREMRIEVGYGLEGVLPDGLAGQIIREAFLPHFRDDQYGAGIVEGTTRVAEVIERNETLTPAQLAALDQPPGGVPIEWLIVPFLSIFIAIGFGMLGAGVGAKATGPILFGVFFGGVPLLILAAFTQGLVAWGVFALALAAAVIGVRIGRRPKARAGLRGTGRGSTKGWEWGSGGSSGGSSGSSGSSGGSSSFGGGSSGGGGASGRW